MFCRKGNKYKPFITVRDSTRRNKLKTKRDKRQQKVNVWGAVSVTSSHDCAWLPLPHYGRYSRSFPTARLPRYHLLYSSSPPPPLCHGGFHGHSATSIKELKGNGHICDGAREAVLLPLIFHHALSWMMLKLQRRECWNGLDIKNKKLFNTVPRQICVCWATVLILSTIWLPLFDYLEVIYQHIWIV